MILQADKGNCTVILDKSTCREKLTTLVNSGVNETLAKGPVPKVERMVQRLLYQHKSIMPTDLKPKLTSYHSKPPLLYGLPKIHKPDIL
jgi:hypothetical protein